MKVAGADAEPSRVEVTLGSGVLRWDESPTLGTQRVRHFWAVTGVAGKVRHGVHNNTYVNLRRGLIERVLFRVGEQQVATPLKPIEGHFEETLAAFRQELCSRVPHDRPLTRQEFVDCYSGRKRTIYERAAASLTARPLEDRDAVLKTFVKCEKLPLGKLITGAPRVIQPRDPRYNVEVGRYLKKMEHRIVNGIAEVFGAPTVFKGINS